MFCTKAISLSMMSSRVVLGSGWKVSSISFYAIRDRRALFAVRMLTKFYPSTILHYALYVEVMSPGSLLILKSRSGATAKNMVEVMSD